MPAPRYGTGRQVASRFLFGVSELAAVALGIVEVGLVLRVVLLLLAANPSAGFSSWVYGLTYPLVAPFASVFPNLTVAGGILETSALLAMLVYALLGRFVEAILRLLARL
jgi:uncharacterized protein YggT (Ycf19 family)